MYGLQHQRYDRSGSTLARREALPAWGRPSTLWAFAAGIVGTGLLAVPVLAGSAAYALGEALDRHVGLSRMPRRAKAFYGTIALANVIGVSINFIRIDPIKALFWSAVINGAVAVPLMITMMIMTRQPKVMRQFTLPRALWIMGWLSTLAMTVTVVVMLWTALG